MKDNPTFLYVANHLGLDFINTQFMADGKLRDFLETASSLRQWAKGLGIELQEEDKCIEMDEVRKLRGAFSDLLGGTSSQQAIGILNKHIEQYKRPLHLALVEGEYELVEKAKSISTSTLLGMLAFETASLLSSDQVNRIKHCEHEKCVLMFLDTSKNKKRRWCRMDVCGNRAKASAHYKNKKKGEGK